MKKSEIFVEGVNAAFAALFLVLVFVILSSCGTTPPREEEPKPEPTKPVSYSYFKFDYEYIFATGFGVPDHLRKEYADWITNTVRAAHNGLSAGDYEDAEIIIRYANDQAIDIYGSSVEGLYKRSTITDGKSCPTCSEEFIPHYKLAPFEKDIFNKLREDNFGKKIPSEEKPAPFKNDI